MSSTNWTLDDLANLEDAIKKGVQRVKYQDKEVTYRSLKEMLELRNEIRKCLGLVKKGSRIFAKTNKGLGC